MLSSKRHDIAVNNMISTWTIRWLSSLYNMTPRSCCLKWKLEFTKKVLFFLLTVYVTWCLLTHVCWLDDGNIMEDAPFRDEHPLVQLVLLVRNKAPVLPYVLSHIHALQYPKRRIILYIRADHCHDRSIDILQDWLHHVAHEYNKTDVALDQTKRKFRGDDNPRVYSTQSYKHIIKLKEDAISEAKNNKADFLLLLDADVVLTYTNLIEHLIAQRKSVIGPLLNYAGDIHRSNFWLHYNQDVWRNEDDSHDSDLNGWVTWEFMYRYQRKCIPVALVHSCLLIHLRDPIVSGISFSVAQAQLEDMKPTDDLTSFAEYAKQNNVTVWACNFERYGLTLPLTSDQTDEEVQLETEDLLLNLVDLNYIPLPQYFFKYVQLEKRNYDLLGFDEIYYINLDRRPKRRDAMEKKFEIARIGPLTRVPAVDGRDLNESYLVDNNIRQNEMFWSPVNGGKLTMGEIGCFLSHYKIWMDVIKKKHSKVLILEDDFWFHSKFRLRAYKLHEEIRRLRLQWDTIALARVNELDNEKLLAGSEYILQPMFYQWMLAYMLSFEGAKKLLAPKPLSNMIPADLYITVLAGQLPMDFAWTYQNHNLLSYSSHPAFGYPVYIDGADSAFLSDTQERESVTEDLNDT